MKVLAPALLFFCLLLCGCTAHLIMDYDDVLDRRSLTALQLSAEEFLSELDSEVGTPAAAYKNNSAFYVKADATLRTIKTRAEAEPKSDLIVKQLEELQGSLGDLQGSINWTLTKACLLSKLLPPAVE